jgi:hypothetical protein
LKVHPFFCCGVEAAAEDCRAVFVDVANAVDVKSVIEQAKMQVN